MSSVWSCNGSTPEHQEARVQVPAVSRLSSVLSFHPTLPHLRSLVTTSISLNKMARNFFPQSLTESISRWSYRWISKVLVQIYVSCSLWSDYDIALLELAGNMPKRGGDAAPNNWICLPSTEDMRVAKRCWAKAFGWGVTHPDDYDSPEHLRQLDVRIIQEGERGCPSLKSILGVVCAKGLKPKSSVCSVRKLKLLLE